jgi:hypothetical protein
MDSGLWPQTDPLAAHPRPSSGHSHRHRHGSPLGGMVVIMKKEMEMWAIKFNAGGYYEPQHGVPALVSNKQNAQNVSELLADHYKAPNEVVRVRVLIEEIQS